jgi:hypothetical protein
MDQTHAGGPLNAYIASFSCHLSSLQGGVIFTKLVCSVVLDTFCFGVLIWSGWAGELACMLPLGLGFRRGLGLHLLLLAYLWTVLAYLKTLLILVHYSAISLRPILKSCSSGILSLVTTEFTDSTE